MAEGIKDCTESVVSQTASVTAPSLQGLSSWPPPPTCVFLRRIIFIFRSTLATASITKEGWLRHVSSGIAGPLRIPVGPCEPTRLQEDTMTRV
jgi:hypothetical protein